jgi:hypothetical protein
MSQRTVVPAVEGWFTIDPPSLVGNRCTTCGTVFFPRTSYLCRNPDCDGRSFEDVSLSTRGTVWSFTDARYQPPPPYVPRREPFEPFALAAVELAAEGMVVLGQLADGVGVDDVDVGTEVELVIEPLFEDDESTYVVWKWRPVDGTR